MFKIGDFSRIGQVSVRMLRHYDKLGLLKPNYTDPFSGYRYYTIEQLGRLHRIIALNGIGLTLQQIAGLLGEGDLPLEQLRGMLVLRQAELEAELQEKQAQLAGVAARLQQIEQEGRPPPYEIVVKAIAPLTVAAIRATVPAVSRMDEYCAAMFARLYAALEQQRLPTDGLELTLYHNEQYTETDLEVETAVALDAPAPAGAIFEIRRLPGAPRAAALIYEGPYAGLDGAVLVLLTWVGGQRHAPSGPLRELHLSGPAHQGGRLVEPAVIELQLPIRPLDDPDESGAIGS